MALTQNHNETVLDRPIQRGLTHNHNETVLGAPVSRALTNNHDETMLGVAPSAPRGATRVVGAITANRNETLLRSA